MTDEILDIPDFLLNQKNLEADTAASESALSDLLCVASRHYAEMAPHVRRRKTAELFKELIEQNKRLQGQMKIVDEVNDQLGIIGMTGSIAWKAQILRLNR